MIHLLVIKHFSENHVCQITKKFTHSLNNSHTHSPTHSLSLTLACSFTHLLTRSLVRLLARSPTRSLNLSLSRSITVLFLPCDKLFRFVFCHTTPSIIPGNKLIRSQSEALTSCATALNIQLQQYLTEKTARCRTLHCFM